MGFNFFATLKVLKIGEQRLAEVPSVLHSRYGGRAGSQTPCSSETVKIYFFLLLFNSLFSFLSL